ncbi:hypothetical protein TNCV_3997361 [Trichonephila clavipes]|nr:hypothetical protein TNCV_3997361 [Trichonephila clavipes]
MALSGTLPQINLGVRGVTQGGHHTLAAALGIMQVTVRFSSVVTTILKVTILGRGLSSPTLLVVLEMTETQSPFKSILITSDRFIDDVLLTRRHSLFFIVINRCGAPF